ncbi:MAG: hypothetical protein DRZ82_08005 [Thermoprotei archaeon]|nr:MAG: hypothetical protein DRZ82_08005 [Thermoprotei archaeon]
MYKDKVIRYFDKPGPQNTEKTIEIAKERAKELGIKYVVVATSSGETGIKVAEAFKDLDVQIIAVTLHAGRWKVYEAPDPEKVKRLKEMGVKVLTCTHALLGNIEMAIRNRFGGGVMPAELIAYTLYRFSQGMKVAIEITLMAADAGLIPVDEEVIAIAGTDKGADTALVIKPAYTNEFFNLEVREIIAMPRSKG